MKKYVAKWKSKKIVLSEQDYNQLLHRFDINNFTGADYQFINDTSCPLCDRDLSNKCRKCTFNKFVKAERNIGCFHLIRQAVKPFKLSLHTISLGRDRASFPVKYKNEGTKVFKTIHKLLLTEFKAVEK